MKKITLVLTLNLIFIFNSFALEVGDTISFISREVLSDGTIYNTKYTYLMADYNKETNQFLRIFEFKSEGNPNYYHDSWVPASNYPTKEEIDDLLKNCENLGWIKEIVKIKVGESGEVKDFDVCRTTKEIFPNVPAAGDIFYYGHFPIYGIVKIEYLSGSSFFYEGLVPDKKVEL